VLALAGLIVVHDDAPALFDGLTHGGGVVMVVVSGAAGVTTLFLVWRNHFGPARVSAALAVAAIVAGWALAQRPRFLPGLTIAQAAASRSTLLALIVAVACGAVVLVPSLILLFRLFLRGHLDPGIVPDATSPTPPHQAGDRSPRVLATVAVATLLAGVAMTVLADPGWILGIGVVCLIACAITTFNLATANQGEE
jgi:cytochrome d ubiquinol oxidase subunit II